jgi:hypothetical protein
MLGTLAAQYQKITGRNHHPGTPWHIPLNFRPDPAFGLACCRLRKSIAIWQQILAAWPACQAFQGLRRQHSENCLSIYFR